MFQWFDFKLVCKKLHSHSAHEKVIGERMHTFRDTAIGDNTSHKTDIYHTHHEAVRGVMDHTYHVAVLGDMDLTKSGADIENIDHAYHEEATRDNYHTSHEKCIGESGKIEGVQEATFNERMHTPQEASLEERLPTYHQETMADMHNLAFAKKSRGERHFQISDIRRVIKSYVFFIKVLILSGRKFSSDLLKYSISLKK